MIEKLILVGEGEQLDFKQSVTNLPKIAKTIVSFANTNGGTLLIGVRDDRFITGIDPEEEKYMLLKAAEFYCNPPIPLKFEEVEFEEEGKTVLATTVKESQIKPHYAKNKNGEWIAYVRVKDKSIPAGKALLKVMEKNLPVAEKKLSDHEKGLISYLTVNDSITLKQFMKVKNFSKRRALKMLTEMVNNGFIRIHDHEKETFYTI